MSAHALTTLLDGLAFAEGPALARREAGGSSSDMHAREVVAMTPHGARETIYAAPGAGLRP